MGPGGGWPRWPLRVPRRSRLGPRAPPRPRPRGRRRSPHQLHPRSLLPARFRRVRRRVLRHLPARGAEHGPAGAAAPGIVLGSSGGRRDRPAVAGPQRDRHLRRRHLPGLWGSAGDDPEHGLRPHRLHPRARGAGDDDRHGLLLLAGGDPPGGPVAAKRRVLAGPGRRRHRPRHSHHLHRVLAPAGPRPGRALEGFRRGGRRGRLGRGGRRPGHAAPLRCGKGRPPDPRHDQGLGRQPGRRLQRFQRPPTVPLKSG